MNLEKLVLEYQNGKAEHFDAIYLETLPLVRAAILNYVTERETVLDLVQDTYLVLIEKRIATIPRISVTGYIQLLKIRP